MDNNNGSPQGTLKQPERDGGAKKNKGFNKNFKNTRNFTNDEKGEQRSAQQGRKNTPKPNQEGGKTHRYPSKPDNYRKFDNRKHHKEYKRSENEISPVKVQELMDFEQELLEEAASFVQEKSEAAEPVKESEPEKKQENASDRIPIKPQEKKANKQFEKKAPKTPKTFEKNERPNEKWQFDKSIEKTYERPNDKGANRDKKEHEEKGAMVEVVGVRFRTAGKIYYFSPGELTIKNGDNVIVETVRGIEFGKVVLAPRMIMDKAAFHPLKPVLRLANDEDYEQQRTNSIKEKEAFKICLEKIRKHELEMKLIDCEYTFDNNKLLFYFTADGRIDFRELVKDLAAVFRTRIELRQIGVRDETKLMGGIGACGRALCCHTYLADFSPVSIKMAKEQGLSLNPSKISGVCGRLMCCLSNEEKFYEEANRLLPDVGSHVITKEGLSGEVHSVNVLKERVRVIVTLEDDEKEAREYSPDELKFDRRHKRENVAMDDELRQLEMLEKNEVRFNLEDE